MYRYIRSSNNTPRKNSTLVAQQIRDKFGIKPYKINDEYIDYKLREHYNSTFNKHVKSRRENGYFVIDDVEFLKYADTVEQYCRSLDNVRKVKVFLKYEDKFIGPYNPNKIGCLEVYVNRGYSGSTVDVTKLECISFVRRKTSYTSWDSFVDEVAKKNTKHFFFRSDDSILRIVSPDDPDYEHGLTFAWRVFKEQYGGYMADVKLVKCTYKWANAYYEANR